MDNGPVALAQAKEPMAGPDSNEREVHEIHHYQSILRFRDAILSGKHPSVKLPPGLSPTYSATHPNSVAALPNGGGPTALNAQAVSANSAASINPPPSASAPLHDATVSRPPGPPPSEFNPILLEKSDELIQAEFKLQRQRLERALKEDVDQRRGSKSERAELLTDIDLSDVLSKALTLVQASSAPIPADSNLTATNEASSDSFDDNTFYSSRHDTPESRLASRVQNESEDGGEYEPSESQPVFESQPVVQTPVSSSSVANDANSVSQHVHMAQSRVTHTVPQEAASDSIGAIRVPGLNNYPKSKGPSGSVAGHSNIRSHGKPEEQGHKGVGHQGPQKDAREHIDDFYVDAHPPSPLVRSHFRQPQALAPQPPPASPFIVQEVPASNSALHVAVAPAQVTALRNEPVAATSPESSPRTVKSSDKKKGKKKKRKMDRQAPEDVMPFIKPEPRSPSPGVNAPAYIRPSKRQKQVQKQPQDVEMTDFRPPREPQQAALSYEPSPYRGGQLPVEYGTANNYPQRSVTAGFADPGYSTAYLDDRRRPAEAYSVPQASSQHFSLPRPSSVVYSSRPMVVNEGFQDQQRVYREHPEAARVSIRPEGDAYGQPRPPSRLLVDSFGREYIEPPRAAIRQSAAPPAHHGEPEIVYERALPQGPPRHAAPPAFDDGHLIYARASSAYPMPRRVVTQPEYVHADYMEARHREYSTRPLGPPAEYVPMAPPARIQGQGEAPPREYTGRAVSVRPVEPTRYEMPAEYGRMQSVRPEGHVREYIETMPAERHRPIAEPYTMDYVQRPTDGPTGQRGFSNRPVERYYDPSQPQLQPRADNVTYIERPQPPAHDFAYTDNTRRDIYR